MSESESEADGVEIGSGIREAYSNLTLFLSSSDQRRFPVLLTRVGTVEEHCRVCPTIL